jgi:phage terminase large subunit-like protein
MLPWQTPEYYAAQAADLTPKQVRRMHYNEWVSGTSPFVEPHQWRACRGEFPADIMDNPLVIGVDAGVTSDNFGIVVVARRNNICYPVIVKKYAPEGIPLDFNEPLQFIRDLIARYYIEIIVYDPKQLHHPMNVLRDEGSVWIREFLQGKPRDQSDRRLWHMIIGREIVHDGNADLEEHVLNANRNENAGVDDNKFRITKRSQTAKNDLAVALSMAVDTAMTLNIG